jgi:hypothetical protein
MSRENYWLAYIQAIIEKNATKASKLGDFTEQEQEDYLSEYPELNFKQIFKNKNPLGLINSLFRREEFREFFKEIEATDEPLYTQENISIKDENHLQLLKYPLINYCPNSEHALSTVERILSISYSIVLNSQEVEDTLTTVANKFIMINEILSVIVSETYTVDNNFYPLSIVLLGENITEYDPTFESNIGVGYHPIYNKLIITNENKQLNLGYIIHELSHIALDRVFDNSCKPYNELNRETYHNAIKNTLLNIQTFIKDDFGLNCLTSIKISSDDN